MPRSTSDDRLLKPAEVADLFRVNRGTVGVWVRDGVLPCIRTPGGQIRVRKHDALALMVDDATGRGDSDA